MSVRFGLRAVARKGHASYSLVAAICLAVGLGSIACIGALTAEGERVQMSEDAPPSKCVDVGSVTVFSGGPGYEGRVKNALRNEAAKKGANYVRMEMLTDDGSGAGTAYKCPDGVLPDAGPRPH